MSAWSIWKCQILPSVTRGADVTLVREQRLGNLVLTLGQTAAPWATCGHQLGSNITCSLLSPLLRTKNQFWQQSRERGLGLQLPKLCELWAPPGDWRVHRGAQYHWCPPCHDDGVCTPLHWDNNEHKIRPSGWSESCRVYISLLLCRTETKPLDDFYTDFFHVTWSMEYGTLKLAVSLMPVVSILKSAAFGILWYGKRAFKSPNLVQSL